MVALLFPYGKDCWRPFHYRIAESLILVPNINQMYKEMKKIQTGNQSLINPFQLSAYQKASVSQQSSVYCWSQKWRRISGFWRSIIFFGIKNVRVGCKNLGSIGNTHFIFGLDISLFLVILIQYSPKHSVINHCDIHTTPLSDTDTVQSET